MTHLFNDLKDSSSRLIQEIFTIRLRRRGWSLIASSNPHPFHRPYPSLLDSPPTIIHPAIPIYVLWTFSSSPNSDHPANAQNPGGGL